MNLSKTLFWDIDLQELNPDAHSRFIVERVLTRGTLHDWFEMMHYYGFEKVKQEAIHIRSLDNLTLHFCSLFFQTPKTDFVCFTQQQSIPTLWQY